MRGAESNRGHSGLSTFSYGRKSGFSRLPLHDPGHESRKMCRLKGPMMCCWRIHDGLIARACSCCEWV